MKKKIIILGVLGFIFFACLAVFFSLTYSLEGAYRSQIVEILSDGYQGYLYLHNGDVYVVNLSGSALTNDKVEYLGKYKHIAGKKYSFLWNKKNYKFRTNLFGIQWLNPELNDIPTSSLEGKRVLWPSTMNKIELLVSKYNVVVSGCRGTTSSKQ